MKKQLLSVLLLFFSLSTIAYATELNTVPSKNSGSKSLVTPANDECSNPTNIIVNSGLEIVSFVSGTTSEATPTSVEFPMHECNDYALYSNDVWFSFTATEKKHIINFSDIQGADGQLYYIVYSGNNCNTMTPVYCHFTSYTLSSMAQNLVIGSNYKIRVMTASTSNLNATFSISITTPTPVINDECSAATTIPVSTGLEATSFVSGNLLGATGSTSPNGCFDDILMGDMWYKFEATSTQHAIKIFDYSDEYAFIVDLFSGTTCNNAVHLSCSSNTLTYITNLVIGNIYRIKISNGSSTTSPVTFNLSIITPPIIPNDECGNAINIPINTSLEMDAYVSGSSYGATMSSQQVSCGFSANDIWYEFTATSVTHILNFFDVDENIISLAYTLYRGDCGTLIALSCDNDNANVFNTLTPGTSYKIRIQNVLDNTFLPDTFKMAITTPPVPSNDNCENALVVPVNPPGTSNLFVSGTTYAASKSLQASTCPGPRIDDVWFSFTATNPVHILKLYNLQGTPVNLRYFISSGDDCQAIYETFCATTTANPTLIVNNLTVGSNYKIRISTNSSNPNLWATFDLRITTPPPVTNDECTTAILISTAHNSSTFGNVCGATPSLGLSNNCPGTEDDDIWYKFVASSNKHIITLTGIGQLSSLNFAVYSGNCDALGLLACSPNTLAPLVNSNYVVGQMYFVRVWSSNPVIVDIPFKISVSKVSTCETAEPFCGSTPDDPYIFANTTSVPSMSEVACLGGVPNPTFYTLKVSESGPIVYNITQNSAFDVLGNPIGLNMDVDFVAWGPFDNANSCQQIAMVNCPTCPSNTSNPIFYPFTNIVDCSYDASFTETLSIPNAIAGQYYLVLITNYNGSPGYIKLTQTNSAEPNAGQTACADKIQLIAFLDANTNGIKDASESNFSYGAFTYQKNNTGTTSYFSNPLGIQSIYDENPVNTYDFNYDINSEYGAYYAETPTNFNDLNIPVGSGTQTLYFPITVTQIYTDVNVSLVPLTDPRPGFLYTNKIIYKNTGTTAASGTLSFTKDENVTIDSVDQLGIINTPTGFSYSYTDLLPSETRSFNVNMMVPPIPTVNIDDVLTNNVTTTIPNADINVLNNTNTISQVVIGAYDPNDKIEAHGESIDFNSFTQDDFLVYTIRFQNTGTANAINVRIEDELDAQLDETSVRMISSSHNYIMERTNNKLIWTFNNIQLPPQILNEEASNGYVTFKIKPNAGFALGDIIPNFAEIYFDTNPPIITNTFNSTFEEQLATSEFSSGNLLIYPNPSNGLVYINTQNTTENLKEINLYDVLGKTILSSKNLSSRQSTIDVLSLAKGIYMIEITTENNYKQTKKLVVK